jgi:hypothetical protein
MPIRIWIACAIAAAVSAVACASTPPPPREIADAEETIALARSRDAGKLAPDSLRKAEDKLSAARTVAEEDGDEEENRRMAIRLAEEAKVDAQLALAESERERTQLDADELSRTLDALENEVHDDRD